VGRSLGGELELSASLRLYSGRYERLAEYPSSSTMVSSSILLSFCYYSFTSALFVLVTFALVEGSR
jgi:hypothetical protein